MNFDHRHFLVYRWRWILLVMVAGTLVMAWFAREIRVDDSVQLFYDTTSQDYSDYREFVNAFGDEDILLVAVESRSPVDRPETLVQLSAAKKAVAALEGVSEVIALSDFIAAGQSQTINSEVISPAPMQQMLATIPLDQLRHMLPVLNRLIADNRLAAGFIVSITPQIASGRGLPELLAGIEERISEHLPDLDPVTIVGMPVLQLAFKKYTLRTAVSFGGLAILVGTIVAFYIFRSIRVTLITAIVCVASLTWVLGIMVLLGVRVNTVTSLCFGFVLVVATMISMHLVTQFFDAQRSTPDRSRSLLQAVGTVLRPCFFCAVTTAVGFGGFILSPVAVIRQAGLIISCGVIFTFLLAFPLAVGMLRVYAPPSQNHLRALSRDMAARLLSMLENMGLHHSRTTLVVGCLFLLFMGFGLPRITIDTYLLDALQAGTPEKKDIRRLDRLLGLPDSISVLVTTTSERFQEPDFWHGLNDLQIKIEAMDRVKRVESPLQLMTFLQMQGMGMGLLSDLPGEGSPFHGYLDPTNHTVRLAIYIDHSRPPNLVQLTRRIDTLAADALVAHGTYKITGQLGLAATQSVNLIRSQSRSLLLVLTVITALMMVQLRSVTLGMLSLVPNLFPLLTIFGCMGWLGIKLDPLTIFSAVVSFGLSVDDTIHYLTQLKQTLDAAAPTAGIKGCLSSAFRTTSRALFSTTAVLTLACLALVYSPFQHISSLGLLIAAAALSAYWADVVFMPALILRFKPIRHLVFNGSLTPDKKD